MKTNVFGDAAIEFMNKEESLTVISRGNLTLMHDIFERAVELGAKPKPEKKSHCFYDHIRVLNALQRDERFTMGYINYPGIINRPTRCFELKDTLSNTNKNNIPQTKPISPSGARDRTKSGLRRLNPGDSYSKEKQE